MRTDEDRLGRTRRLGGLRKARRRRPWLRTRCAALALACASLPLLAASAQAGTGGASTTASTAARDGRGLAFSHLRAARATWYGPGLYGSRTACGEVLRPRTIGVAHRRLPCGTAVEFVYGGRRIVARVIDRGPYSRGTAWDLTNGARRALGFGGSGRIHFAVALRYARQSRHARG